MSSHGAINYLATGDGNPVAAHSGRTATDVVTADLVFRLTRGVEGSGRTVSCTPMTGEIVAELPEATPHDVEVAFGRAREAQRAWASLPVRRRAAVLLNFHDILLDKQAEAMDLIQVETGKARLHAHEEVQGVAVVARHYGRKAPRTFGRGGTSARIRCSRKSPSGTTRAAWSGRSSPGTTPLNSP